MIGAILTDNAVAGSVRFIDPADGKAYQFKLVSPDGRKQEVNRSRIGSFPPKTIIGDFQLTSHEWLSALVQADWQGGGQVTDSQEATDIARYSGIATLESRYPHNMTLLPLTEKTELAGNTAPAFVLGDLQQDLGGTITCWVSYGTNLRKINGGTLSSPFTLGGTPVTGGITFRGSAHTKRRLYIPYGASGYEIFDPSAVGTELSGLLTTVKPLNFAIWDNKLWCLTTDGSLYRNSTGDDSGWGSAILRLESEGDPRKLVTFVNRAGEPCLFAVTSREAWVLDVGSPAAYSTDLEYPPHPSAALGASKWDGKLHVSAGIDVGRYDGATVSWVGLVRDQGVSSYQAGKITDLYGGLNDLFALLEGDPNPVVVAGDGTISDVDVDLLLPGSNAPSSLMRLDRLGGWHTVWSASTGSAHPTNVRVSAAGGDYRLYWGFGGAIYFSDCSRGFQNPAQNPTARFAQSGRIVSSWFDMQKTGMELILAAVECRHRRTTSTETITVRCQLDDEDGELITLGVLDSAAAERGLTRLRAGLRDTLPDGTAWYEGLSFGKIRYILDFTRGADDTKSPLLESIAFVYMPKMGDLFAYNFRLDCSADGDRTYNGKGKQQVRDFIGGLIGEKFVPFNYRGDEWHIVKVTGISSLDATGQDLGGDVDVSLVETYRI